MSGPSSLIEMQETSFRKDILPLKDKLFRLALRITLNRAEAEDIVQETMLRVWNKRDQWAMYESVEAFCMTVTRNLALDSCGRKEPEPFTEEMGELLATESPYEQLIQNEQLRLLHRIINGLSEKQRTLVQLRDIEGKSYREIAEITGYSEEQVKINLFRARQKIKQQYLEIDGYGL